MQRIFFMAVAGLLSAGCRQCGAGGASGAVLLEGVTCGPEAIQMHADHYDDPVFDWELMCGDLVDGRGQLRISAILPTERIGCQEAEGPACSPCLPTSQACGRQEQGLASGYIAVSGDRPLGAGYRMLCDASTPDPRPEVMFFFEQDGEIVSCLADSRGRARCSQERCRLQFQRSAAPAP